MLKDWLSTAYEVTETNLTLDHKKRILNHNNISCGEGAGWEISQAWDTQAMCDGDELTLPEGYGIDKTRTCKWHGILNNCGNETCWDLEECQFSPEKFVATITLPEKPKKYEPFPQISELSEFESDKPENSAHGYTEGSEVIGNLNLGMDSMVIGSKNVEPSESQEEIAGIVTKGQFIDLTAVAKQAHSEGKKEGWNEAIIKIGEMMVDKGYVFDLDMNALLSDIQKLRK